jgi:hypothetical protein
MDAALEELVPRRARFRCEYCLLPQALINTPFQFDHIIARCHGGLTISDNLAFACFHCNNFKGPNLAGIDPDTGQVTRLFHPRNDSYKENFRWDGQRIIGLTAEGRATISVLRLNHPLRLAVRRSLLREGVRFG